MIDDIPTLTDIIKPGDPNKAAATSPVDRDSAAAPIENSENLQDLIADIVDSALSEAIPAIEEQLREHLISSLHEQLGEEITRLASTSSGSVRSRGKKRSSGTPKEHNPSLYGF